MIETPRLLLRPMREDDADALLHIFADPVIMAGFGVAPFGPERMARWVRRNLDHQERHGYGLYSVILKESGLLVGDCGLEQMDDARDAGGEAAAELGAELGYDLRRDHWNRGLATEAATAMRDYAFGTLRLPRLVSLIRAGNGASRRVAEKVGMTLTLDAAITWGGHPYWRYAMNRADTA